MVVGEWMRRLWYLLNRRRIERELRENMEEHRAMMGTPRDFGNTLRLREAAQDVWGWAWLEQLGGTQVIRPRGRYVGPVPDAAQQAGA